MEFVRHYESTLYIFRLARRRIKPKFIYDKGRDNILGHYNEITCFSSTARIMWNFVSVNLMGTHYFKLANSIFVSELLPLQAIQLQFWSHEPDTQCTLQYEVSAHNYFL